MRYARTLLHDANEQHCEAAVYEQLVRLTDNYSLAIGKFNEVLSNPMVGDTEKIQLLKTAIGDPIHPCLIRFLEFVTEKKRENKIFLIALKYQEMYRKEKHLLKANITAATELESQTLEKIKTFVENAFDRQVEIHVNTDPSLIGGFMLDIEHDRMDASVVGQLNKLKKELQL